MPSLQLLTSDDRRGSRAPAREAHLTTKEWDLILEALSAYKHHTVYRELYEKLAPVQTYT